ncbi:MAG: hypothetical protein AB7O62_16285 [Pirellulales bacterium]
MPVTDETVLETAGVSLRFWRVRDRIWHSVFRRHSGSELADQPLLLSSVEGDADDDWPTSPPFQNIHVERRPDGEQIAFLIGMAGSSHWSASVQLQSNGRLIFDVACLVRASPRYLGSTYGYSGSTMPRLIGETVGTEVEIAAETPQFTIRPPTVGKFPATIRWRYEL